MQKLRTGLNDIGTKAEEVKKEVSNVGYIKYDSNSIQKVIDGYGQVENKAKELKKENAFSEQEKRAMNFERRLRPIAVKMERLKIQSKELDNQAKETSGISKNINNFSTGIDKVTSKIKRFALSLFSIRSAYALVSKASSAYLSQDTALANKLQAVWIRFRFIARTNYI